MEREEERNGDRNMHSEREIESTSLDSLNASDNYYLLVKPESMTANLQRIISCECLSVDDSTRVQSWIAALLSERCVRRL